MFATLPYMPHIHTASGQYDITVSAFIVRLIDDTPHVLLHMHKKFEKLLQPGGHVELHENPWQAIAHELTEETGYTLEQLTVLQPAGILMELPGEVVHPIPCIVNTHAVDNISSAHYHTDSAYAFYASEPPVSPPVEGESTDLRWLNLHDVTALPESAIYEDTRLICQHVINVVSQEWHHYPTSSFSLQ